MPLLQAEMESWWTGEDFRIIEKRNSAIMASNSRVKDPDILVSKKHKHKSLQE